MYTLKAENEYNNIITLTSNKNYVIISVEGLNPPPAIINKVKNASEDGSTLNSTSLDDRQIIITLNINAPVEKNRIELFKYFKTGKNVKLYYSNDTRNVNIEGIVQNFTVDYFAKKQVGQITIDCTKPFFKDVDQETKVLSNVENLLEFPLSIEEPIAFSEISENNIHLINARSIFRSAPPWPPACVPFEVRVTGISTFWSRSIGISEKVPNEWASSIGLQRSVAMLPRVP